MDWPRVNADTSIEEIQRIHKDIWNYVIEHDKKPDGVDIPYMSRCVLCDYAFSISRLEGYHVIACEFCPAKWPNQKLCGMRGSLFRQWTGSEDPEERRELAERIRDVEIS